jgi:hypothetical protein
VSAPSMPIEAAHEVVAALALLVLALLVLLLLQPAATSAPIAVKAMIRRLSMEPSISLGLSRPGPGSWADETMRCPPR